jgi:hypothetical protein
MKTRFASIIIAALGVSVSGGAGAVDGVTLINQATVTAAGGFPYTLSQPGSYRLSGNLIVSGTTDGIDITASNVTIDLNGFSLSCSNGIGCFNGISVTNASSSNITITRGSVTGPFQFGVEVGSAADVLLEELHVANSVGFGADLGSNAIVRRCSFDHNGAGINVNGSAVIDRNVIANSKEVERIGPYVFGEGIVVEPGASATITGNSIGASQLFGGVSHRREHLVW